MIAILGGLGAAVLWASSTVLSSRASKEIGAVGTLGWMMLVGLVIATPLALLSGPVPSITPDVALWMAGSSVGSIVGFLFVYTGLKLGKVGVVAALASTEGAIAAVVSVATGEPMSLPVAAMLCVIVVGLLIVGLAASEVDSAAAATPARRQFGRLSRDQLAVLCGVAGAACFGITIYSTGKLGGSMTPLMAIMPVRVLGVLAVFLPLALTRRLRMTRGVAPLVVWIGFAEVFGNASYVAGARESIAISAVLASQFGAIAAVAAFVFYRERLTATQRSGVVAIALGVAALTLVRP